MPSHPERSSHFEQLGGEAVLRALIDDFIDRMRRDLMIGFFFRDVDPVQLKEREFQFARAHLGGPGEYQGRPLQVAHARHPILGGQFNRRSRILSQVLRDHHVPEEVSRAWLAHVEQLRPVITGDDTQECNTERAAERALAAQERAMQRSATFPLDAAKRKLP